MEDTNKTGDSVIQDAPKADTRNDVKQGVNMPGTIEQKVFFPVMRGIGVVLAAVLLLLMVGMVAFLLISNITWGGVGQPQVTYKMAREWVNEQYAAVNKISPPQKPLAIPAILKKYYNTAERRHNLYTRLDPVYKTDTEKQDALRELSNIAMRAAKSYPDYVEKYLQAWHALIGSRYQQGDKAEKPLVIFETVRDQVNKQHSAQMVSPKKSVSVPFNLKKYYNTAERRQDLYARLDLIYKTGAEKKAALKELSQIVSQAEKLDPNHAERYILGWLNIQAGSEQTREIQAFMNQYVQPVISEIQPLIKEYITHNILPPIVAGIVLFLLLVFTIVVVLLLLLSIEKNTRVRRAE